MLVHKPEPKRPAPVPAHPIGVMWADPTLTEGVEKPLPTHAAKPTRRMGWWRRMLPWTIAIMLGGVFSFPAYANDIVNWSTTDSANTAAPPNGWPAGMLPTQVEPTAQAMMGAIARFYNSITGKGSLGNFYVSTAGSDAGSNCTTSPSPCDATGANNCSASATPCRNLSHAVAEVADFRFPDSANNDAQINIQTAGTYSGATIAGHFLNASGNNAEPCLYIVGTGDATSGTPTHISSAATNGNIEVSGNACVVLKNMDFTVGANAVGFFTQDGGSHVLLSGDVSCTGPSSGTEAQACGHAEGGAYIEATGPNPRITMQGDFAWLFTIGATPGKLTFDPGANGVLSCGTGLTLDPAGGSFLLVASHVALNSGWSWASNCTGITGHPVVAQNNSTFINGTGSTIPNVGSFRIFDTSNYYPQPSISLGTCTGGGGSGVVHAGSTVYSGQVDFSGLTASVTSCNVVFDAPGAASSWFTSPPFCTVSELENVVPATKWANVSDILDTGFTVIPSSSGWGSTESFTYHCFPSVNG